MGKSMMMNPTPMIFSQRKGFSARSRIDKFLIVDLFCSASNRSKYSKRPRATFMAGNQHTQRKVMRKIY
jgi:hypothetical protein